MEGFQGGENHGCGISERCWTTAEDAKTIRPKKGKSRGVESLPCMKGGGGLEHERTPFDRGEGFLKNEINLRLGPGNGTLKEKQKPARKDVAHSNAGN